jgi:hypothetical protein
MYNTATKSFTVSDNGDFGWITQDMDTQQDYSDVDDDTLNEWVDQVIERTIEYDDMWIEQQAQNNSYPMYGYTVAKVFVNEDEYIASKKQELRDDLAAERDEIKQFIKSWIADLEQ